MTAIAQAVNATAARAASLFCRPRDLAIQGEQGVEETRVGKISAYTQGFFFLDNRRSAPLGLDGRLFRGPFDAPSLIEIGTGPDPARHCR